MGKKLGYVTTWTGGKEGTIVWERIDNNSWVSNVSQIGTFYENLIVLLENKDDCVEIAQQLLAEELGYV